MNYINNKTYDMLNWILNKMKKYRKKSIQLSLNMLNNTLNMYGSFKVLCIKSL